MGVAGHSRHTKPQDRLGILDLVISTLLEHEKEIDELEKRFDDQLLKLEMLRNNLCDLTDKLAWLLKEYE